MCAAVVSSVSAMIDGDVVNIDDDSEDEIIARIVEGVLGDTISTVITDDLYDVIEDDAMLVFGESADEETGAIMRALYLRYVAVKEKPEDVLDKVFAGWRNLAKWHRNSCHVDAGLDLALWSVAWLNGEYEHVNDNYKQIVKLYITKRRNGHARDAARVNDEICARNTGQVGGFQNAFTNIDAMMVPKVKVGAHELNNNTITPKTRIRTSNFDATIPLLFVEINTKEPIKNVEFYSKYDMEGTEYVPLAVIIGVPGHFRSALNVTAMAKRLAPGRTIDDAPPVWYGFDHYADQEKTEAIPRIAKLASDENLVGLLLVKVPSS